MPRRSHWLRGIVQSYWSLPAAIIAAFSLTAVAVVWFDEGSAVHLEFFAFGGGASAARSVLTTIAGSYVTVAGLTLSLTIVVLQIVAGQLTPRAVRGLLDERIAQVTAGSLFGIFAFCLVVLRAVRDRTPELPGSAAPLGVDLAVLLALAGLVLLLVFIHHVAESLQVSTICARIAGETLRAIDRAHPAPAPALDPSFDDLTSSWDRHGAPITVAASRGGFLQRVDLGAVGRRGDGAWLAIDVPAGRFVTAGTPLGRVWGGDPQQAATWVEDAVVIDQRRDLEGDPAFGIRQLADIALRAVSPGVNDPTTALTCVGWLRACLERLAVRDLAPASVDRLIVRWRGLAELTEEAFLEIGRHAAADPVVIAAVLEALEGVARTAAATPGRAGAVRALAREIAETALAQATFARERDLLRTLVS